MMKLLVLITICLLASNTVLLLRHVRSKATESTKIDLSVSRYGALIIYINLSQYIMIELALMR